MRAMIIAAAAAGLALGGCNIVAPAYYLVHGPEKQKALYELPKGRSVVVFIDDRANRVPRRALRLTIAEEAEKALLKSGATKDVISTQSAMQAAGRESGAGTISVAEIGQRVQADVIVYATMDQFSLSPDGASFRPASVMRVKVIDAKSEKRLWPKDDQGYTLTTTLLPKQGQTPTNTGEVYKSEDELARNAGQELAWLFYTHEPPKGIRTPE